MLYSVPQLTCFLLFLSQPNPWNGLMLVHPVHPPLPTWGRCSNAQVPKMSQMLRCCTTGLPDACKPTNPSLPSESWTSTWFTVCGSRAPHSAWEHCRLPRQSCHLPGAGHLSSSNCDFPNSVHTSHSARGTSFKEHGSWLLKMASVMGHTTDHTALKWLHFFGLNWTSGLEVLNQSQADHWSSHCVISEHQRS